MFTMSYNEAIKMFSADHKALALFVAENLNLSACQVFENALDWSLAAKLPTYVNLIRQYRAKYGKAPKNINFAYIDTDIHIVNKHGEIII